MAARHIQAIWIWIFILHPQHVSNAIDFNRFLLHQINGSKNSSALSGVLGADGRRHVTLSDFVGGDTNVNEVAMTFGDAVWEAAKQSTMISMEQLSDRLVELKMLTADHEPWTAYVRQLAGRVVRGSRDVLQFDYNRTHLW